MQLKSKKQHNLRKTEFRVAESITTLDKPPPDSRKATKPLILERATSRHQHAIQPEKKTFGREVVTTCQ